MRIISHLYDFVNRELWDGPYRVVECKKALSPSKLPDIDYALNPYGGCAHGCIYCYAPEVTHSPWNEWRVVRVKGNIPERLGKELSFVKGTIGIGTSTDPYQYAESRFRLTEQCLGILKDNGMKVHIHTKSDLITRDTDLIAGMSSIVGITVTNTDDTVSKITEPGAPLPARRFSALKTLTDAGIETYALVGPVLNKIEGRESELVKCIVSTGTGTVYLDRLNMRPLLSERLGKMQINGSVSGLEKIRSLCIENGLMVFDVFKR